jgi:dienelactone hydrolase
MSCCKLVSVHDGQVRGSIQIIRQIPTYIKLPPDVPITSSKNSGLNKWHRALLLLSEGHGLEFPNIQLLADALSEGLKCPVIAPDQFRGKAWPLVKPADWDDKKEIERFQTTHHPATVEPILDQILDWIEQPTSANGFGGVTHLGAIGYCFGGRYVIRLLAAGKIKVGVLNHPSFFTIDEVRSLAQRRPEGAIVGASIVRPVWAPLAIFAAEEDDIFSEAKRRATEDALKHIGATWWCATFSHTKHGFRYVPTRIGPGFFSNWP